jgi:hypothetical protein
MFGPAQWPVFVILLWLASVSLWLFVILSCCALRCCCTSGARRASALLALALTGVSIVVTLLGAEQLSGAFEQVRATSTAAQRAARLGAANRW